MGVQVYKHYCGEFLESVDLFLPSDNCGDEEDSCTAKKMSCCDDEVEVHQLKVDFVKTQKQVLKRMPPAVVVILYTTLIEDKEVSSYTAGYTAFHIPDIPIYKRLQRYTLYA